MKKRCKFKDDFKIRDLGFLNELGCEIVEFFPKNDSICGKLYVTGSYRSSKNDLDKLISEDIPFTISIDNKIDMINDIDCDSFNYSVIEGYGISFDFDINVDYEEELESLEEDIKEEELTKEQETLPITSNNNEEERESNIEEQPKDDFEEIKDNITNEVDKELLSKLEVVCDNIPSDEKINILPNDYSERIVVYYNSDKDIDRISKDYNVSFDQIYKDNKHNDIDKHHRLIVNKRK